jgi:ribulose-phosphate 3-epimerase
VQSPSHSKKPTAHEKCSFDLRASNVRIAPSLLSADFTRLSEHVQIVEAAGAEMLHLDVMDGHFAPNISFGPPVIKSLRKCTTLYFDAHLMISEPGRYAQAFVEAGCDLVTFHVEAADQPDAVVEHIRSLGAAVGVSINPDTPVSAIEPIVDQVDLVLVMSVWPGFSGQKFIPSVLDKVRTLRGLLGSHQRLEIDGGIDPETIGDAVKAGADTLVAGSAVFGQQDPGAAFEKLRRLALSAAAEVHG